MILRYGVESQPVDVTGPAERCKVGRRPKFPRLGAARAAACRPAIRNGRRRRPLDISHLGIEKGLIMGLSPHRVRAIVALFRHPVERSGGLRGQFAQVQYLRGFSPSAKFTYDGLSEVGKRCERDMKTICAIKVWSAPPWCLEGAASECRFVAIGGQRAVC